MPLELSVCDINPRVGSMTKKTVFLYANIVSHFLSHVASVLQRAVFSRECGQGVLLFFWSMLESPWVKTTEVAQNNYVIDFDRAHPLIMNDLSRMIVIWAASQSQSAVVVSLQLQGVLLTTLSPLHHYGAIWVQILQSQWKGLFTFFGNQVCWMFLKHFFLEILSSKICMDGP